MLKHSQKQTSKLTTINGCKHREECKKAVDLSEKYEITAGKDLIFLNIL